VADYIQILCVRGSNSCNDRIDGLRDWIFRYHARFRFIRVEFEGLEQVLPGAALAILDWSLSLAPEAERTFARIRKFQREVPILLVHFDSQTVPERDRLVGEDPDHVSALHLSSPDVLQNAFLGVLEHFKIRIPLLRSDIEEENLDRVTKHLIQQLGTKGSPDSYTDGLRRLNLIVEKFLPDNRGRVEIMPVTGGWSGTFVLRLVVDGQPIDYYLKFFPRQDLFRREIEAHSLAREWLGDRTVDIVCVPDMGGDLAKSMLEAFPPEPLQGGGNFYPVLYRSASDGTERKTFKDYYSKASDQEVERAVGGLLDILKRDQPDSDVEYTIPIHDPAKDGFFKDAIRIGFALDSIDDLRRYAREIPGVIDWDTREADLANLLKGPLPGWLREKAPAMHGKIHADTNSRNELVNPRHPEDIVLIDCGAFRKRGMLVFDLSIIEADLKFVLLSTEDSGYADLDPNHLKQWCTMERVAVQHGLEFSPAVARTAWGNLKDAPPSLVRAYSLIGRVRERARVLSPYDEKGVHYFADQLFWALRWLKRPEVKRTKKLLALYSASEILKRFKS